MNPYSDWMKAFFANRMMNDKNGRPLPDPRLLLAKRKLAVALEQKGAQRSKNERRLALSLKEGSGQRKRNELRLALALGLAAKKK